MMARDTLSSRDVIPHLEGQFGELDPRATGVAVRVLAKEMCGTDRTPAERVVDVYRAAVAVVKAAGVEAPLSALEHIAAHLSEHMPAVNAKAEIVFRPQVSALTDAKARAFRDFHCKPTTPAANDEDTSGGWPVFSTHVEVY